MPEGLDVGDVSKSPHDPPLVCERYGDADNGLR